LTIDESAALRMNLSNKIAYDRDQVTAMQLGIVRSKSGVTSAQSASRLRH
jgi:hypothetical protein